MKFFLLLLLPAAAYAQLSLVTWNGTTATPVGVSYSFGQVAQGSSQTIEFRIENTGAASVAVTALDLSGAGFTLLGAPSGQPVIAPSNFLEFSVEFSAPPQTAATFSASLQVNSISVILTATSTPAPELIILSGSCTAASSTSINFGSVQNGALHLCNISIANPNPQSITISTIAVTGAFQGSDIPALPLTLTAGQATDFVVQATPACGTTTLAGSIVVNTQTYGITGTGFDPLLPTPSITFSSTTFASAQQPTVSITLPTAAACPASGYLNLAFTPSAKNVLDDQSIVFLAGSVRSLPFAVAANQTTVAINGATAAAFQTGTTAGAITFTMTGAQMSGNPSTTITIPPSAITIDSAAASDQVLGQLNIELTGFDNTYSAGVMTFSFFDTTGKPIGSPVNADFTQQFQSYFSTQQTGSSFLMAVSFPVQGNQAEVGTVQVTLTNAAGEAQTGTLTFQ